jgi:hypothetical protein
MVEDLICPYCQNKGQPYKKHNHYVQRALIENFTLKLDKNIIYRIDKQNKSLNPIDPIPILFCAMENEFHSQGVETLLDILFERQGILVIKNIFTNETFEGLTKENYVQLLQWVAIQYSRTRSKRELIKTSIEKRDGKNPNKNNVRFIHEEKIGNLLGILTKELLTLKIYLGINQSPLPFILSDDPVSIIKKDNVNCWWIPISPTLCLSFCSKVFPKKIFEVSEEEVDSINKYSIKKAYRYVFSNEKTVLLNYLKNESIF